MPDSLVDSSSFPTVARKVTTRVELRASNVRGSVTPGLLRLSNSSGAAVSPWHLQRASPTCVWTLRYRGKDYDGVGIGENWSTPTPPGQTGQYDIFLTLPDGVTRGDRLVLVLADGTGGAAVVKSAAFRVPAAGLPAQPARNPGFEAAVVLILLLGLLTLPLGLVAAAILIAGGIEPWQTPIVRLVVTASPLLGLGVAVFLGIPHSMAKHERFTWLRFARVFAGTWVSTSALSVPLLIGGAHLAAGVARHPDSMHPAQALVGIAGFAAAGLLFFDVFWKMRVASQIGNLATSKTRSLASGLVELQGTAKALPGYDEAAPLLWAGSPQKGHVTRPFLLEDETGTVLIDPGDTTIRTDRTFDTSFNDTIVLTKRCVKHFLHERRALFAGDPVHVIGCAEPAGETNDGAPQGRLVVRPGRVLMKASPLAQRLFGWRERLLPASHNNVFLLVDTHDQATARRWINRLWQKRLVWTALYAGVSGWLVASAL